MKRKMKLKYLLLGLLAFTAVSTAQVKQRFPSAVRYIAGYYVASRPYFPTLETALNDVKAYATAEDPYVFWIMGDTIRVADWDSVFTESGLTMKDSIDQYYVSAGKIKWAGFGQGGGTGSSTIARASQTTTHYSYPNWNQFSAAFPYWQRDLAKALDSIDQHIYDLIVYTAEPLYIENDTLKIDTTGWNIGAAGSSGWDPDTNRVVVTDRAQTIASVKTFTSGLLMGTGSYLQIPSAVGSAGTARLMWSYNNRLYFNTTGTDSSKIVDIDVNADTTRDVNFISWYDLTDAVRDSITRGAIFMQAYIAKADGDTIVIANTGANYPQAVQGMSFEIASGITTYTDSSVTVPAQGVYVIHLNLSIDPSAACTVVGGLYVDDVFEDGGGFEQYMANTFGSMNVNSTHIMHFNGGEVLKCKLYMSTGTGTLIVNYGSFNMSKILN